MIIQFQGTLSNLKKKKKTKFQEQGADIFSSSFQKSVALRALHKGYLLPRQETMGHVARMHICQNARSY